MTKRADALAGLRPATRLAREADDLRYLYVFSANKIRVSSSHPALPELRAAVHGERIDALVCQRVDLDHQIQQDSVFSDCEDCGARLQNAPDALPSVPRICICCAAARVREDGS